MLKFQISCCIPHLCVDYKCVEYRECVSTYPLIFRIEKKEGKVLVQFKF